MLVQIVGAAFVLLPVLVHSAEIRVSCITPNGETGNCTPLRYCHVIFDAILKLPTDSDFFIKSKCDHTNESLVCCGSEGTFYQGSPLLPNRTVCGIDNGQHRVIGGNITNIGEFPWMVLLRYKNFDGTDAGFKCGGTLINERYVLTAAHCVSIGSYRGFGLDSVRLGEWRISTERDCEVSSAIEDCADPVVDLQIEKKIVNAAYNRRTTQNDIALLRLEKNVKYTRYIRPICLPHPNSAIPLSGTKLIVAGWGKTENKTGSDVKLKAEVPVVARSGCSAKIRQQKGGITENHVCAGGDSNRDSCQGDSGGPLMGKYEKSGTFQDQWCQEGIVSWGINCAVSGVPAVYTRVAMYMDWIIENLSEH